MTTMKWKVAASVAVAVLTATTWAAGQGSIATDREALEVFYHATSGHNWENNTGWLEHPSLGRWRGVDIITGTTVGAGRVGGLRLSANNLTGPIPVDLARLYYLTVLALGRNNLHGRIPPELGQLRHLRILSFRSNNLHGTIPAELSQLQLDGLNLSSNGLTGSIPPELGQMANLATLHLENNNLSGTIPAELGRLSSLARLNLADNDLTGLMPAQFGQLARLRHLILDNNHLNGPIPAEIGRLVELGDLSLANNNLSGPIPAELGQLVRFHGTTIRRLNLANNNLSGPIPAELGELGSGIPGQNPPGTVSLANNDLSGPIPAELGRLRWISELNLANNNLSGPIPAELGELGGGRLVRLHLAGNNLSGPIPAELAQLDLLGELTLDTTTGLCLPADFPEPRRTHDGFATLVRELGLPECAADVPTLPARLTLSATPTPAEGGPEVALTATLDEPAPADGTTVTLTTGGTATLDTDYTLSSTTITIAEGQTAGTTAITVIDDAEVDAGETIVLDATSANPTLTAPPLTLTIEDNDVPVPALPAGGALLLGALLLWRGAVRARDRNDR